MSEGKVVDIKFHLDAHIDRFDDYVAQQDKRWQQFIESQESTNQSIKELTDSTKELHSSTKDIVEAWNAATGAVKVGSMVGRFIKWLTSFAIIGGVATWIVQYIKG